MFTPRQQKDYLILQELARDNLPEVNNNLRGISLLSLHSPVLDRVIFIPLSHLCLGAPMQRLDCLSIGGSGVCERKVEGERDDIY